MKVNKQKELRKKYYQENKKRIKEYKKKYRKRNSEKLNEYSKKWYQENIEKAKEQRKKYRQKNKEKRKEYDKKQRKENPEKIRKYYRKRHLTMLEKRAGKKKLEQCEVCGALGRICFDHNHETGEFRGWICDRCNLILGLAKDNPYLLKKLVEYLMK